MTQSVAAFNDIFTLLLLEMKAPFDEGLAVAIFGMSRAIGVMWLRAEQVFDVDGEGQPETVRMAEHYRS
jgi:hypothetical protein